MGKKDRPILPRCNKLLVFIFTASLYLAYVVSSCRKTLSTVPLLSTQSDSSLSRIVWALSSSHDNHERITQFLPLWKTDDTRVVVWTDSLPSSPPESKRNLMFRVNTATTRPWWPTSRQDVHARKAWMIADTFLLNLPNADWYVLSEDDTLWFPHNLVETLKGFSPDDLVYIGNLSEDHQQLQVHGRMAYGAAGIVISRALAQLLTKTLPGCLTRYSSLYGHDGRISSCIYELGVPLTRHQGFHQLDVTGDITGLLEAHSPDPVVSFAHLHLVQPIFPHLPFYAGVKTLIHAGNILGPSLLQQFVTVNRYYQWTFSVSHGYSLKWWDRSKLVPWVRSVELTFDRFLYKQHGGSQDWSFDNRIRHPRCKGYDAFYYNPDRSALWTSSNKALTASSVFVYTRSSNINCNVFPWVQEITVTALPGVKDCEDQAVEAQIASDLTLELCSYTGGTLHLRFTPLDGMSAANVHQFLTETRNKTRPPAVTKSDESVRRRP